MLLQQRTKLGARDLPGQAETLRKRLAEVRQEGEGLSARLAAAHGINAVLQGKVERAQEQEAQRAEVRLSGCGLKR